MNARPLKWESSALIAAHLPPGFESAFFKKGYLLILISGGVTRDVQVKHIYHKDSKTAYREREREMKLMLDFLIENSTKERFDGADMH